MPSIAPPYCRLSGEVAGDAPACPRIGTGPKRPCGWTTTGMPWVTTVVSTPAPPGPAGGPSASPGAAVAASAAPASTAARPRAASGTAVVRIVQCLSDRDRGLRSMMRRDRPPVNGRQTAGKRGASVVPDEVSTMVEFQLLGPVDARVGQRVLVLGGPGQRALLTLLLVHANEPLSLDRLVDQLWNGQPPPTAAKIVQLYVSRLRKELAAAGQ